MLSDEGERYSRQLAEEARRERNVDFWRTALTVAAAVFAFGVTSLALDHVLRDSRRADERIRVIERQLNHLVDQLERQHERH
jgi:flagellar motility protein MotE (MotC chaperone)